MKTGTKTRAILMLSLGMLGEVAYGGCSSPNSPWDAARIAILLWWSGAATFFLGATSGILFGIPKTIETASDPKPALVERRYKTNANIEEISDWLTKIIIGLGLANFRDALGLLIAPVNSSEELSHRLASRR